MSIPQDPVRIFAHCAGRMSAEIEFRWLMGDGETDAAERQRGYFVEMIEAVIEPGTGPAVLAERIEAKMAHAALLHRSTFSINAVEARMAAQAARQNLAGCRSMLTS